MLEVLEVLEVPDVRKVCMPEARRDSGQNLSAIG